jgi:GT2 family glycosyltransferase
MLTDTPHTNSDPTPIADSGIKPDISLVIVNYNVKEFLANLLVSVDHASKGLEVEIFVVDNNSSDGSMAYLKRRFPKVRFIENTRNVGFGKANNQAIRLARGKYTLLINPDTLIKENTLRVLFEHMEQHPETGAAGCKILNPDGSFADESRRTVPTPWSALAKVLGLAAIFPRSQRFAGYYMNWLSEDTPSQVPVISGSFMFFRTEVLKELDGFDERFFMYGEDIDLCYRLTQRGMQIDYVPSTSIIHYKGESTKKDNIDYIIVFNKAMYQFFDKHYSYTYTLFFRLIIVAGIVLRGLLGYLKTLAGRLWQPVIDLTIINVLVIIAFLIRYGIHPQHLFNEYQPRYLIYNLLMVILFVIAGKYYDLYGKAKFSATAALKATLISVGGTALITYFFREYAFSRWILLSAGISGALVLSVIRLTRKNLLRHVPFTTGQFQPSRLFLVGLNDNTAELIRKLRSRVDWNYHIAGIVTAHEEQVADEVEHIPVVGTIAQLPTLCRYHRVHQLIFLVDAVSHEQVLQAMTQLQSMDLVYKIVPNTLDYIIGKSNVEYFDNIPVVDVQLPYYSTWNRFAKRNLDICLSIPLFLILLPVLGIPWLWNWRHLKRFSLPLSAQQSISLRLLDLPELVHPKNLLSLLGYVILGKLSIVGAPIKKDLQIPTLSYKYGLLGLRQYQERRLGPTIDGHRYELHYLQNYSIWKDLDIVLKSVIPH